MIKRYIYDIEKDEYNFGKLSMENEKLRAILSDWRYKRTSVISNPIAKKVSLFAGLFFQKILLEEYGISKESIEIKINENGKPELLVGPKFSLSHSGRYIALVFSDSAVGVDIEHKSDNDGRIARRMFAENEKRFIEDDSEISDYYSDKKGRFLFIWTRKESYLKMTGEGITVPLYSFDVLNMTGVTFETEKIDDYIISVCTRKDD